MPKQLEIAIKESLENLKKLARNSKSDRKRARLKALILIKSGAVRYKNELAKRVKYHRETVANWLTCYQNHGLEKMLFVESGGNGKKKISAQTHQAIEDKLSQPDNGITSYVALLLWVQQNHQSDIQYEALRKYCRRNFGTKLKVG